jgi:D-galactarolactone cycloisomerase
MSEIRTIDIFHYRHSLAKPLTTVMGPVAHRPAILVRLEDKDGAQGWGEIWCNFPPEGDVHRARLAANILPAALSRLSLDNPFEAFDTLRQRLNRLAIQAGEPGPVDQISAGVDIAIHDLVARRNNQTLTSHLGGKPGPVEAYASGIAPDLHEKQIERMRALGYRRFKQRIGFGADDSLAELEAASTGLRTNERLIADANQAWTLEQARTRMDRLGDLNLAWLEEPMPADTPPEDWIELADASVLPLAGGENLRGRPVFDTAIQSRALQVIQPDICKWGGLSACRDVARNAVKNGLNYSPHFLGGGVGLIASGHLLRAVGGPGWLEVDSSENPLLWHFSDGRIELHGGKFSMPDGPGLGYVPDTSGASDLLISHETREIRP